MTEKPQLTLYNSLTRKKEAFTPKDLKRVTMYNCGPTVYSYAHIGNARAAVVADVLFRVLMHIYDPEQLKALSKGEAYPADKAKVVYARNITDVDDKIIAAAKEQGVKISEITEKFARIYNEDLAAIGCLPPTHQPKATDHIPHMIEMISTLIKDGHAYASDGHVFFDVSTYENYGKLSGNTLENLRGGDRVGEGEVARKKNAADFVLWKPELDGVGWDAPFGKGRPGWHIECSVMAKAALCDEDYGNTIDIHCGGVDLKFPHHENERAQSCCANDTDSFAKYWVHNEFLNMGKDKMSKSLGNVKLIHDLLKDWDGEVIRLALLKAHYRSELTWTESLLEESKEQLDKWYRVKAYILSWITNVPKKYWDFDERLRDPLNDINTPILIGNVNLLSQDISKSQLEETCKGGNFLFTANLLGLLQKDPEDWFRGGLDYDALVAEYDSVRAQALAAKEAGDKAAMGAHFKRSDEIRDQFKAEGVVIESGQDGKSSWRKA